MADAGRAELDRQAEHERMAELARVSAKEQSEQQRERQRLRRLARTERPRLETKLKVKSLALLLPVVALGAYFSGNLALQIFGPIVAVGAALMWVDLTSDKRMLALGQHLEREMLARFQNFPVRVESLEETFGESATSFDLHLHFQKDDPPIDTLEAVLASIPGGRRVEVSNTPGYHPVAVIAGPRARMDHWLLGAAETLATLDRVHPVEFVCIYRVIA